MKHILLDSAPLGLLTSPRGDTEVIAINQWAENCFLAGHQIYLPEIIDYELRRELIRAKKTAGLALLDKLKTICTYLPLNTATMLYAANLWANSRNAGNPTGDPKKLDIDVILCAQAITLPLSSGDTLIIATMNVKHITGFVSADLWTNIIP